MNKQNEVLFIVTFLQNHDNLLINVVRNPGKTIYLVVDKFPLPFMPKAN